MVRSLSSIRMVHRSIVYAGPTRLKNVGVTFSRRFYLRCDITTPPLGSSFATSLIIQSVIHVKSGHLPSKIIFFSLSAAASCLSCIVTRSKLECCSFQSWSVPNSYLRWIWTRFCSKNYLSALSSTRLALSSCKKACCSCWEIISARTSSPRPRPRPQRRMSSPRCHCLRCDAPTWKISILCFAAHWRS